MKCVGSLQTLALVGAIIASTQGWAQGHVLDKGAQTASAAASPRIAQTIDDSVTTTLRGNVHPLAGLTYDQGPAPPTLTMNHLHLVLRRSPAQEAALDSYLASTQSRNSANYHKWLTPEKFGALYGPSEEDIEKLTAWLEKHSLTVNFVAKGRTIIDFSGPVARIGDAFHVAIHSYRTDDLTFVGNTDDPQIPTAFANVVAGISRLNTVPSMPMSVSGAAGMYDVKSGRLVLLQAGELQPEFTNLNNDSLVVTASDAATIYNSPNLKYNPNYSTSGLTYDGTGATIGIIGRTAIDPTIVTNYRGKFLGDAKPPIISNFDGVGEVPDDEFESYLDNEVSAALAPGATIHFYTEGEADGGVIQAAILAIEDNTIDVLSLSYLECEPNLGSSGNQLLASIWQQAAAQGITIAVAAGDTGSAGCNYFKDQNGALITSALGGLAVNGLASTPYNVAVGGTNFYPLSSDLSKYVNTNMPGNSSTYYRTAYGYIPESSWNDSSSNNTTLDLNVPWTVASGNQNIFAGAGGPSTCGLVSSAGVCTPYPKPSWQTGPGVPVDGARDLPDLSLFSGGLYGHAQWAICDSSQFTNATGTHTQDCARESTGYFYFGGALGTSASAPAFAGVMALVVEKTGERQGQAAEVLYNLAQSASASSIFNDIAIGNNAVPCTIDASNASVCLANAGGYDFESGFATNTGFDFATGLGSVNVTNLVNSWSSGSLFVANVEATPSATTISSTEPVTFTVSVTPLASGLSSNPAGTVTVGDGMYLSSPVALSSGTATINIPANSLAVNPADVLTIAYTPASGSGYAPASAFVTLAIAQALQIASISPNYGGPAALIDITGTNFGASQGNGSVTVGGALSYVVSWSNTSIVIQVPSRATTGNVVVTAGGEVSNGVAFTFYPYPVISSVLPGSGPIGTPVTISGSGLLDGEGNGAVSFNGSPATILSQSSNSLLVDVPASATTGSISVRANGNTIKSSLSFTVTGPHISGISPNYGAPAALIRIAGINFGASQGSSSVTVGGAASYVVSWSNTAIAIQVPSRATTGDIVVAVAGESSNGAAFSFYSYPDITGISPVSGPVGTSVTISGTGLLDGEGNGVVTFNGVPAAIVSQSNTGIQVSVPAGASSGPISIRANGDTVKSSSSFTVTAPQISLLSPGYGAPSAQIGVLGTNFGATQGSSTVTIDGALCGVTAWSDTSITVRVPSNASTGDLVVRANGETSNGSTFTFYPFPAITSVALASSMPGTAVTITGNNLLDGGGNAAVTFNGSPATIGSDTSTSILASVPAVVTAGRLLVTVNGVTLVAQSNASAPTPDERADALLAQMTQAEKLQMVEGGVTTNNTYGYTVPRGAGGWVPGIPRLNIPDLYFADGSVGVNFGVGPATALPSSIASAAGWDVNEAYKYGNVIGTELSDYGINVNLGGNINLTGREPRDGRTFETKGEDPILAGKIAAAHLNAVQAHHIIADIKHFAFNDQETGRATANALIEERGGRESDLLAFEIGLKDSNVQSVMCSYNLTNGVYDCENPFLLNTVLKGDWGFPGFVMSDWWATHSTAAAANAGLDQEQPNQQYFSTLGAAVQNGEVPQSRLDNMVHRILRAMFLVGIFDDAQVLQPVPAEVDAAVAQEVEEQGAVLLKNAGNQLPLKASGLQSIAVIGSHADVGVLSGGGSAQVQPIGGSLLGGKPCPPCWAQVTWDLSSPRNAIQAQAPAAKVQFADGTDAAAAAALAAESQVAIVFVSQWTSEGMDLPGLNLTDLTSTTPIDQDALVAAVAAANPHTVVVVESGGALVMPWLASVGAVLEAWYPGQSGGPAIADLLFGVADPSGKLPITFPASVNDLPRPEIPQPPDDVTPFPVNYFEGFNVGYKWFDANSLTPLFPFGYGLSYTSFSFSNAALVNNLSAPDNPNFQVTFTLTNTGAAAGAEVAQVYLGLPASTGEPAHRLVGWQKVMLQPGASQAATVEVDLNDSSHPMSYWDVNSESWLIAAGDYIVYLGDSSAAASLTAVGTITVAR
jgi:beta-glucosidase